MIIQEISMKAGKLENTTINLSYKYCIINSHTSFYFVPFKNVLRILAPLFLNNKPPNPQYVSITVLFVNSDARVLKGVTRNHEHTTEFTFV
jgi:hypothetical protein